jgi:hypothetical protein
MKITRTSPLTGETHTLDLPVTERGFRRRAIRLDGYILASGFASLKAPRCPQFFSFLPSGKKIGSPASRSRGAPLRYAALTLAKPDAPRTRSRQENSSTF